MHRMADYYKLEFHPASEEMVLIPQKAGLTVIVRGEWEFCCGDHIVPHFKCSVCGARRYEHYACDQFKFCPECGAKMK